MLLQQQTINDVKERKKKHSTDAHIVHQKKNNSIKFQHTSFERNTQWWAFCSVWYSWMTIREKNESNIKQFQKRKIKKEKESNKHCLHVRTTDTIVADEMLPSDYTYSDLPKILHNSWITIDSAQMSCIRSHQVPLRRSPTILHKTCQQTFEEIRIKIWANGRRSKLPGSRTIFMQCKPVGMSRWV